MKSALAISTAFLILSATVEAYANPLSCSGTCTNAHDPSLIRRDDGTYFRFSTGKSPIHLKYIIIRTGSQRSAAQHLHCSLFDKSLSQYLQGGKVAVHTAPSIQGPWTYKGAALPSGSKINKADGQDLWAPDVSKVGSTYYLYYSVSSFGSQDSAVGVATSSTMDVGSWTDLGSTGVESVAGSKFNAIDGNLQVADGKMYMNFGSFWSDLFQIEMTAMPTKVAKAVTSATQIAFVPTNPQAQEASFGYKYGNYYYLFFSVGSCCSYDTSRPAAGKEYKIQACRASSVSGPFVDKSGKSCLEGGGTTVLASHDSVYGPGGQGVFNDPSLGPVLYYHYVDTRVGYADSQKQFGVNKLDFSSGWPVV